MGEKLKKIFWRWCSMTTTQVAYWNLQELKQHNRATEEDTDVANAEVNRHNTVTEQQNANSLLETARHNKVSESVAKGNLKETVRSHKANERISKDTLKETRRSNKAREHENHRSNVANEAIGRINAAANTRNAQTNARNADTAAKKAAVENRYTKSRTKEQDIINKHANTREASNNAKTIAQTVESGSRTLKNVTGAGKDVSDIVSEWIPSAKTLAKLGDKLKIGKNGHSAKSKAKGKKGKK